jgi:hypothetical protein
MFRALLSVFMGIFLIVLGAMKIEDAFSTVWRNEHQRSRESFLRPLNNLSLQSCKIDEISVKQTTCYRQDNGENKAYPCSAVWLSITHTNDKIVITDIVEWGLDVSQWTEPDWLEYKEKVAKTYRQNSYRDFWTWQESTQVWHFRLVDDALVWYQVVDFWYGISAMIAAIALVFVTLWCYRSRTLNDYQSLVTV